MESPLARPRLHLGSLATVTLAAAFAFRRLDDFDTFWHLAAGRFIALQRAIPAHDVLSHTVRDHPWTNLQWGYDLALYLLHAAGGARLLGIAATLCYALSVWLLLRLVRPRLGDAGAALLVLAALLVMEERFVVRPEMVSFPLLLLTLSILERGRSREGRGLYLLLPVMLLWVNAHALFVLGASAILAALLGALAARALPLPRSLRGASSWDERSFRGLGLWGGVALLACLLNPFGVSGVLFPIRLLSRIGGGNPAFRAIAEFRSPFDPDVAGLAMTVYKVLLLVGVLAVVGSLIRGRKRPDLGLDLGGFVFFAGLAALSVLARRNAALFALGGAPFIARALGTLGSSLPEKLLAVLRRGATLATLAAATLAFALAGLVAQGAFYRWDGASHELGSGVLEGVFPIRAAAFAREARLPPKLYNDIAAGGYLAWDDPTGKGVFIDGRLEVYDTAFYADYVAAMYDPARWQADADRFGVETVILLHRFENRRQLVERLVREPAWSLVYADEVAAIFVRTRGNEAAIARATSIQEPYNRRTQAWLERPLSKGRFAPGRIDGTRAFARLLATIGDAEGSAEVWSKLLELGVSRREEVEVRLLLARHFSRTQRSERARAEARRILDLEPGNPEARALLAASP